MSMVMQKSGATAVQRFQAPNGVVYFSDSAGLFLNIPEPIVPAMVAAGYTVAYTANPDSFTGVPVGDHYGQG